MVLASQVKELLVVFGTVQAQDLTQWRGSVELPLHVQRYYQEVGPVDITIPGYGNPYFFPSLAKLWELQEGYRWSSPTSEQDPDWNDDWLVVGTEGADPFITGCHAEIVWQASHAAEGWDLIEFFPDINSMIACLAQLGIIVVSAGEGFTDEYSCIQEEYIELAHHKLSELLGSQTKAQEALALIGWV